MKQTRGTNGVAESGSPAQIPRRGFVKGSLGVAGFAATAAVLAACADNNVLNADCSRGAERAVSSRSHITEQADATVNSGAPPRFCRRSGMGSRRYTERRRVESCPGACPGAI